MSRCVNKNCKKNPHKSINCVVVNIDGDLACDEVCRKAYEQQKAHFFNVIVQDETKCRNWLLGL